MMNTPANTVPQTPKTRPDALLRHALSEAVSVAIEKSCAPDFSALNEYAVIFLQETLSRQHGFQSLAHLQQTKNVSADAFAAKSAWEGVMQLRCRLNDEARASMSALIDNALNARRFADAIQAVGEFCWRAPQLFHAQREQEGVFKTWFVAQVILASHSISARKLTASVINLAQHQTLSNWLSGIYEFIPSLHPDFFQLRDQLGLGAKPHGNLPHDPERKQPLTETAPHPTHLSRAQHQRALFSQAPVVPH